MAITMQGKIALVSGGGAGIGKAICEAYAELGATLVVAEINAAHCEALRQQFGDTHLISQTDVTKRDQVEKLRDEVAARFGKLDVMVNNVGHHLGLFSSIDNTTDEEIEALYDINLRHMFIVTRAMIGLIRKAGAGSSIINVSSIEGFRGFPNSIPYTTFKHAVTGFTRATAMQLAPDGIRVNCIGPETTESEQVPLSTMIRAGKEEAANRTIPMNRFGRPEDHAGVAVFLATELSSWMTGSCLVVDGGGLCAAGFQRTPRGGWTIAPEVVGRTL